MTIIIRPNSVPESCLNLQAAPVLERVRDHVISLAGKEGNISEVTDHLPPDASSVFLTDKWDWGHEPPVFIMVSVMPDASSILFAHDTSGYTLYCFPDLELLHGAVHSFLKKFEIKAPIKVPEFWQEFLSTPPDGEFELLRLN